VGPPRKKQQTIGIVSLDMWFQGDAVEQNP
jgi:hypothetical protein